MNRDAVLATVALGALAFGMVGGNAAFAQKGATGVVKQRIDLMKALSENMKVFDPMMRGKAKYDAKSFKASLDAIAGHAGQSITKLFPKGSAHHSSRATEKIWRNWPAFVAGAERLKIYGSALAKMAKFGFPMKGSHIAPAPTRGSGSMEDQPPLGADGFPQARFMRHLSPYMVHFYMVKSCKACHDTFRKKKDKSG